MSGIIGITMGDPCGVGPEISVRALSDMAADDRAATRIYGNLATLNAARDALGLSIDLQPYVVDIEVESAPLPWGSLSPVAGDAAFRFIEKAVRDAEAGTIGCIVTAPSTRKHSTSQVIITMAIPVCCEASQARRLPTCCLHRSD